MAIVPVFDDYTDYVPSRHFLCHTPVALGNGLIVMMTTKTGGGGNNTLALTSTVSSAAAPFGPQARLYALSGTSWTRGNPVALPVDTTTSRACAATLDGNVIVQGQFQRVAPPQYSERILVGTTNDGMNTRLADLFHRTVGQGVVYTGETPLRIDSVTVTLRECVNYSGLATVTIQLCEDPYGVVVLASATVPLENHTSNRAYTVSLDAQLTAAVRYYYVVVKGHALVGSDQAYITGTSYARSASSSLMSWYFDGSDMVDNGTVMLFDIGYYGPDPFPSVETRTGYAVLDVNAATGGITPGDPTAINDSDPDAWGNCVTGPDAMARIGLTNRYWAWRSYPDAGIVALDLLQVVGPVVSILGTTRVNDVAGGSLIASAPHQIIPISATEMISLLSLNDTVKLVHAVVDHGVITASVQGLGGTYPPPDGATLVPGVGHQAEVLLHDSTTDPMRMIRLGVDWRASTFTTTALPVGQIGTAVPPDYTPRSKAAYVSPVSRAAAVAQDGALWYARPYVTSGTDDNWILLVQYSQSTGDEVARTWVKGDRNGSTKDQLTIGPEGLALRWDPTIARLILGATEILNGDQIARLGVYRSSYELDTEQGDGRQRFER